MVDVDRATEDVLVDGGGDRVHRFTRRFRREADHVHQCVGVGVRDGRFESVGVVPVALRVCDVVR